MCCNFNPRGENSFTYEESIVCLVHFNDGVQGSRSWVSSLSKKYILAVFLCWSLNLRIWFLMPRPMSTQRQ